MSLLRQEYQITEEEYAEIMEISGSDKFLFGHVDDRIQGKCNVFWQRIADKYGFAWLSARPIKDKGPRFFTAVRIEPFTPKHHIK